MAGSTARRLAFAGAAILAMLLSPARLARAGCGAHAMPLHALATAKRGQAVRVSGVVTAVFPRMRGFFIEAPRGQWDRHASTSEAVFVYGGRHVPGSVARGQRLSLSARYQDYHGVPELAYPRDIEFCGRHALPPPVTVSLPQTAREWKAMLGMRIRMDQALTVDDLDDFTRYGEVRLHAGGRHYAPTALTVPGPAARRLQQASAEREIWLDDGNSAAHPHQPRLGKDTFDALHPLRVGDIFESVAGIAYHAYGRDLIEVTPGGRIRRVNNTRPVWAALGLPPGLRLVTFNVENYFNHAASGPAFPTARGARTRAQWQCQTHKLVAALQTMQPAIAGLEEIENNGYGRDGALATLVGALNHAVRGAPYRFIRPHAERLGTDLIAPALIYDMRRVVPVGRVAALAPPGGDRSVRAGLTRPALAASFRSRASGAILTVVVVHLRSKRSRCGASLDSASGGGHCARARARAIPFLQHWIAQRPTGVASSAAVLLGDFNAYPLEAAIRELRQAGWRMEPAMSRDPGYTENGRWGAGRLDYIFLSPGLTRRARGAAIWHIDADEARGFGYAGRPACRGNAAPYRASDHDPVIIVLSPPATSNQSAQRRIRL